MKTLTILIAILYTTGLALVTQLPPPDAFANWCLLVGFTALVHLSKLLSND